MTTQGQTTRGSARPVLALIMGFFTGLFLTTTLLLNSVIPLESNWVIVLPVGIAFFGFAMAKWFPIRRRAKSH
jgi:hypothetical protein